MVSLAEYTAAVAQLHRLGLSYEQQIRDAFDDNITKEVAIDAARGVVPLYTADYRDLLDQTMRDAANTTITHYEDQLGIDVDHKRMVDRLVKAQHEVKYYGATLGTRLLISHRRLVRRIEQSAQVGPEMVSRVFTQTAPFGSQIATDQRILLGTLAKIENDVAKEMAQAGGQPLIRWTLSQRHSAPDLCDDLANNISKSVQRYIRENDLKLDDLKGVYLIGELPLPPHPNCQCEYGITAADGKTTHGVVRRTIQKVRSLLRKLRGK